MGGNVRVGFEDNFFLSRGVPAHSNAQLVEKAARILDCLDKQPATPREAMWESKKSGGVLWKRRLTGE